MTKYLISQAAVNDIASVSVPSVKALLLRSLKPVERLTEEEITKIGVSSDAEDGGFWRSDNLKTFARAIENYHFGSEVIQDKLGVEK